MPTPVVKSPIAVGFGSIVGVIVAIGTAAVPAFNSIVALVENTAVHWSSGEKIGLISGAATAAIVVVGRFAQAVAAIIKGG
jgi:hypothetical protein